MEIPRTIPDSTKEKLFLAGIFFVALFLFLGNLGNQCLWEDEAETALVSKTILTHGIPMGYDGKNYFSQQMGADYNKNYVWTWHPWLQFYILAVFFKLFGVNTFVARLPFAIFGIASVFVTYILCKTLWQNKKIAAVAALLLLFCIPFLILSRQCRYYSMAAFFSLLGLYAYIEILNNKKNSFVIFIMSSVLLFHTHYIYCVMLLATVMVYVLFFHRNQLRTMLLAVVFIGLINVPWIIWVAGMGYGHRYGPEIFRIERILLFTGGYLYQVGKYVFPPYLLLMIPVVLIANRVRGGSFLSYNRLFWQRLLLLLIFIIFNLIAATIASPSLQPFFRYLAPIIPVFAIITAVLIIVVARLHPVVSIVIMIALIITSPIKDFLYEITHDYNGPIEGIVKYLNENGNEDDMVAITYGDMPLKFYTNMRIIGGFTGEDLSTAVKAKWIILRNYVIGDENNMVRQFFLENVRWENYERIKIDYPDIPFENREDPAEHRFRTVTDEDRVVIFRKIR